MKTTLTVQEEIILVNENDEPIGFEEKIKAHENGGKLHRAFSVCVFNSKGQLMLQLRSVKKHHFGGLWTNTCCSHPRRGEELEDAAHRRLKQEMGFDTELKHMFSIIYKATDAKSGLTEHEFDHIFIGRYDGTPKPDAKEVDGWKWADTKELEHDAKAHPEKYTPWFRLILDRLLAARH
jgi:isopentenyl-diphosphate delta-isomerase